MRKLWSGCLVFFTALALICVSASGADGGIFVNDGDNELDRPLTEYYAVGAGGVDRIGNTKITVLSASGISELGTENYIGGGGLVYDDHTVPIRSAVIRVGLRYYYSDGRDTSLAAANLENAVGSGYAFGYYDENRCFVELERTEERQVTMRPLGETGIGVYITGTDTLLYSQETTGKTDRLGILPLCEEEDAITWFAGKRYYGGFEYAVLNPGGITVINTLPIEQYTMGVCACEMGESFPPEALKAQAVAARTYAQKNMGSSVYISRCGFDVTADTYSQAYNGYYLVGKNVTEAVRATENEYLTWNDSLIDALYFSSDGGATEDNSNVNGYASHPYLAGVWDPYEAAVSEINANASWRVTYSAQRLGAQLGVGAIESAETEKSPTGNTIALRLTSEQGETILLQRDRCRTALGRRSLRYDVSRDEDGSFVFEGSGWGHSLGMSQWGAYAMAAHYQKTYREILGFYYTGVGLSYGETGNAED